MTKITVASFSVLNYAEGIGACSLASKLLWKEQPQVQFNFVVDVSNLCGPLSYS